MRAQPFVGLALALALGIHLGHTTHWLVLLVISLMVLPLAKSNKASFIATLLPFFILGAIVIHQKEGIIESRVRNFEMDLTTDQKYLTEKIKEGKWSARITSREIGSNTLLYTYIKNGLKCPLPGDTLVFMRPPERIGPTVEPMAFDFQTYARYQGVHYTLRINDRDEYKILKSREFSSLRFFYGWKKRIEKILHDHLSEPVVRGLALGILLGDKSQIPQYVENMMSSTGTLHVMAVSGLHVGIICGILMWTLGRSGWWPLRLLKLAVCLLGVWAFVLITGARPSAIRAATMFSLYIIGWTSRMKSPPLNILAAGAFFLLCSNPYLLYQVSFQLSVSAVASILIFFPIIQKLWKPRKPLLKALWGLSAMSLSVQILVAPVSIFYFHTFPLTFLPANIIAIPMATIMMVASLGLVSFHFVSHEIGHGIGSFIEGWTNLGLSFLSLLNKIDNHTIDHLWPGKEVVLIFILGAVLIPFTLKTALWARLVPTALIVASLCISNYQFLSRKSSPSIISYPRTDPARLDINDGADYYVFSKKISVIPSPFQCWSGHSNGYTHQIVGLGDTIRIKDHNQRSSTESIWVLEEKGWGLMDTSEIMKTNHKMSWNSEKKN